MLVVIWCLVYTRVFFRRIAGCTTVLNFTIYNLCMCFKNHNQQNNKVYSYHSTCLVLLRMLEKSGSPWMDLSWELSWVTSVILVRKGHNTCMFFFNLLFSTLIADRITSNFKGKLKKMIFLYDMFMNRGESLGEWNVCFTSLRLEVKI